MSQKHENVCVKKVLVKVHRKSLSLAVKLHVNYMRSHPFDVCKVFDSAASIIQYILKNKDKIKECEKIASPFKASKLNSTLCMSNY